MSACSPTAAQKRTLREVRDGPSTDIGLTECGASLDESSDDVKKAISRWADWASPIIHRSLTNLEQLCRGATILAANYDRPCLAHASKV